MRECVATSDANEGGKVYPWLDAVLAGRRIAPRKGGRGDGR